MQNLAQLGGRPVFIADYRREETQLVDGASTPVAPRRIRYNFPTAGEVREGGTSDGYCYRITFAAGRLEVTYKMVLAFLREHGYGDLPLPANAAELRAFRLPPKLRHQLSLFGDDGYVHNPLKIIFPRPAGHRGALRLELYDERTPNHLLRFHRRK
ncbi:MAG: hypothetical protein AAFZ52_00135 [Bacteroidota bacterium]